MVRTYKVVSCFRMPKRGSKVVPAQSGSGVFTIDMSSTSTLDIAVSFFDDVPFTVLLI